jgi:beta-galactosidase
MDEARAAALAAYADGGGLLVLAPRAGVKDRCNAAPERPLPAWLDEFAGLEVVDYVSAAEDDGAWIVGSRDDGFEGDLRGWYEQLELRDAVPVAEYADGDFAGTPAVAAREVGRGRVVYIAGAATRETLTALYRSLWRECGLPLYDLPEDVEAVQLRNDHRDLIFLLNHADEERFVELGADKIALEPLGIALVGATEGARV